MINNPLIDFIKIHVIGADTKAFFRHSILDFYTKVNQKTGEMDGFCMAEFQGLKFKIYESTSTYPEGRLTIEGSLHNYWNGGKHNWNDFSVKNLNDVIDDLQKKFDIKPEQCRLLQCEIGVNVDLGNNGVTKIVGHCIMHKKMSFKDYYTRKEGKYKLVAHQQYSIKIYDKGRQFRLKSEILRFEVSYKKMRPLNIIGVYNLSDLVKMSVDDFKEIILSKWHNVLFYEESVYKGDKYEFKYNNPFFWEGLTNEGFKYHRKLMREKLQRVGTSFKEIIANLLQGKIEMLCSNNPN